MGKYINRSEVCLRVNRERVLEDCADAEACLRTIKSTCAGEGVALDPKINHHYLRMNMGALKRLSQEISDICEQIIENIGDKGTYLMGKGSHLKDIEAFYKAIEDK